MRTLLRLLLAAQLGWSATALADGRERLSAFLDGLQTLEAGFEQSVLDTENSKSGLFHGMFMLWRPGRFRWDYVSPYEQTILADGKDLWIIDADLEQITQQRQASALKGTPALLLAEEVDLEAEFEVVDIGEREGLAWLELLPRDPDSQFVRVLLAFEGSQLQRMEMADKFGQISRFRFFDVIRNPQLDPKLFKFERPQGFDLFLQ
ncbi:MAG: outer rane lipoprotein carrier protein [Pseudomonadota bacterium]